MEFRAFDKIPRLSRQMIISEKIDGTNGLIAIGENGEFQVGSRNKWLTNERGVISSDNAGFARWAISVQAELEKLGPGFHYGEWWGQGIQRGYGMKGKHFSLFNTRRWNKDNIPSCVSVVPVIYEEMFDQRAIASALLTLETFGSVAAPGFAKPEGIVIYHVASGQMFKKTIEGDASPKSLENQ